MSLTDPAPAASQSLTPLGGGESLVGLAALGKVALALALVLALVWLASRLVRRLAPGGAAAGQHLRVVGSAAVGQRERVVIVEVEDTWLVLGVGGGQVNRLHDLPAPTTATPTEATAMPGDGFAARFASALGQQLRGGRPPRDQARPGQEPS
ncbi:flagellar biosynthetic protein FliO [Halomonas sp. YLGW01]|uniref:flagellar biosynthetic protein FliO n=1 Tax=Halomonas sp. YLGW01 TaxID=2773308 RepID=UPI001F5B6AFD|nr:flagellar biosynthetic protein FliO [Halomonas sp. YLGW01]